jgi:hypothetical protein
VGEVIDNLKIPANTYLVDGNIEKDGKENFSSLKRHSNNY